jgi:enamine deaminase RidA (YjgF/YER057c/UK114 family)
MTASLFQTLQPAEWRKPSGYSNGIAVRGGRTVYVAGQVGWNEQGEFASSDMATQSLQALKNITAVLTAAGGKPEHVVRMTWYVTSLDDYRSQLKEIGAGYRTVMGKHFPTMTLVQVVGLAEREAKVEIEATAVVPD